MSSYRSYKVESHREFCRGHQPFSRRVPRYNAKNVLRIQIANIATVLLLFCSTLYYYIEFNGHSNTPSTSLTPHPYVLLVWIPLCLLLLGLVAYYQFTVAGLAFVETVGVRLIATCICHSFHVHFSALRRYRVALLFANLTLMTLTDIYASLISFQVGRRSWTSFITLAIPFSLWHAWSTFVVLFDFSLVLSSGSLQPSSSWIYTFLLSNALVVLAGFAWTYALIIEDGDLIGASFMAILLWGIYHLQKFRSEPIITAFNVEMAVVASTAALKCAVDSVLSFMKESETGGYEAAPFKGRV